MDTRLRAHADLVLVTSALAQLIAAHPWRSETTAPHQNQLSARAQLRVEHATIIYDIDTLIF